MNILPHKSWHVRTKKNIARVRRDEEKARREEEELQQRISLAEHEARIVHLKQKQGIKTVDKSKNDAKNTSEQFDLFNDFKDKIAEDSEKKEEKKIEQEKWEVRTGIFSYLDGRYKHEKAANDEWYLKSHEERMNVSDKSDETIKNVKDERNKRMNDPLENMKSYLSIMKKNEAILNLNESDPPKIKSKILKTEHTPNLVSTTHKRKHKKRKKRKHHSSSSGSDSDNQCKKLLLQKLRTERLDRERRERDRAMQLVHGPSSSRSSAVNNDVKQKYNSQFNPHLAKQNFT
ncbi:leukocyte receptor cluster member 1-like protein [Euroglyphus maynei]|uniref:Leukocyte receptor cluster member 1-like protein n=1 Tax=Euroglyphus maynei TaxID=6958 RepID=A0A1Y3BL84_EURMA|nr:leukocyte receptor cluster member 1-like protein [Euroglyphus maynei]